MIEEWEVLDDYPLYAISSFGNIINMRTGVRRKAVRSPEGVAKITLSREGRIFTKSIARLVAKSFIPENRELFNTVINTDGDRMNCYIDNLAWRPRWFAIKFHQQFEERWFQNSNAPLMCVDTGDVYNNYQHAAIMLGVLARDIQLSCETRRTVVFPDRKSFRYLI